MYENDISSSNILEHSLPCIYCATILPGIMVGLTIKMVAPTAIFFSVKKNFSSIKTHSERLLARGTTQKCVGILDI